MKKPAINLGNQGKTKNNNQQLTTFVDPDDQLCRLRTLERQPRQKKTPLLENKIIKKNSNEPR